MPRDSDRPSSARNVLGGPLACCCLPPDGPRTGFYRDGYCHTGPQDTGSHTVCAVMTAAFLAFSQRHGNDLVTPRPEFDFPGLQPGDHWCLCVSRWKQAFDAGVAPPVKLVACHEQALKQVTLAQLQAHAV
jgi:uncharacterized protein